MRTVLTLVLVLVTVGSTAHARPSRRQCLRACRPLIATCRAAGKPLPFCRRTIVHQCRTVGVAVCSQTTTTFIPVPTSTSVTIEPSTTTTTVPLDRTVNKCNRTRAMDLRQQSAVTVREEAFDYAPECIRVAPNTPVTFAMQFSAFPLVGGEAGTPDPASPFGCVKYGFSATFRIAEPGVYGYYSDPWWMFAMYGAVIVEPAGP